MRYMQNRGIYYLTALKNSGKWKSDNTMDKSDHLE